ncbi:MAG: hypothetical protein D6826_04070 [Alphaproteobacteria bacterium]|nr:MAG: hypothetical protein D6826_04070 [Alphaproteobacteria bacterium]
MTPIRIRTGRTTAVRFVSAVAVVLVSGLAAVLNPPAAAADAGPWPDAKEPSVASLPPDYWHQPLAAQGEAPQEWSELERSLAPEACGQCHDDKYEQWRTSLHAQAFSPGLVGQLLTYDAAQTASCMECHAPLAEQKQAFEAARARGQAHQPAAQGLAAAGNSCAGCHLRRYRRYGPPERETGATGQSDPGTAHGGVFRSPDFEASEFCAACHQHDPAYAINGKPLENTVVEWRASPQAAQGITCQGCHMPERKHLWRGIHDPDMVARGLSARFHAGREAARFDLTNSGVGHAFPTYITPKVVMRAVALDASGAPRPGTAVSRVIQRTVGVRGGRWVEFSDTRLLPGETASLTLPWQGAERIRMWLDVYPDDYYDEQVYDALLAQLPAQGAPARLIAAADARARASRYRLFETELTRPD